MLANTSDAGGVICLLLTVTAVLASVGKAQAAWTCWIMFWLVNESGKSHSGGKTSEDLYGSHHVSTPCSFELLLTTFKDFFIQHKPARRTRFIVEYAADTRHTGTKVSVIFIIKQWTVLFSTLLIAQRGAPLIISDNYLERWCKCNFGEEGSGVQVLWMS